MKKLEKYIIENRNRFDSEEPDEGHFERFARKQSAISAKKVSFSWKYMIQAAAVSLLVILSSLWVYEKLTTGMAVESRMTLADISPEYKEAEIYYTTLINSKYNEIKSIDFKDDTTEQDLLLKELSEMNSIYKSLEKELNQEKGNEMIVNAMIRHYQLKIEIMNRILEQLHLVRNSENLITEDDEKIIM